MNDYQRLLKLHASEFAKESMKQMQITGPRSEHVSEAIKLYNLDWVKEEEKKIFFDFEEEYHHPSFEVVDAFVKKVTEYSKKINVPDHEHFEHYVEFVGFENYAWLKQVWWKLEKYDKKYYEEVFDLYHKHLYRSSSGRLDYYKIIDTFSKEKKFPSKFTEFFEYSTFAFEDKLKDWFKKVDKKDVDFVYDLVQKRCKAFGPAETKPELQYDFYLLAYWLYRFTHESATVPFEALTSEYGGKFEHPIADSKESEYNMAYVSAYYGHFYAFEYFWKKMSTDVKSKHFSKLIAHTYDYKHFWNFHGSKFEITVYLFHAISCADYWAKFLDEVHAGHVPLIFIAAIYSWSYSYFWFPTFDNFKYWIPKAKDLSESDKDYAFRGLVNFYSHEWSHHEWTHSAKKVKEFAEKIFEYSEYKF